MPDKALMRAFVTPAQKIWEDEIGTSLEISDVKPISSNVTTEEITAVISFKGDVEGSVLYGFSQKTARTMIDFMMGEETQDWDSFAGSALGELAQLISTHATSGLAAINYNCRFSVPIIVDEPGQRLNVIKAQTQISLKSEIGPLIIRFAVKEAAAPVVPTEPKDDDMLDWLRMQYKQP